jgi:DNA-binding SARP family transcriptional activator
MQALQLYRGELMPGFHLAGCAEFDRWLEDERHALAERAAGAAWALAQRYESENQLSDAAGMARNAMRFSWSDERALRRALMMLDRLGDRAAAARLFDEFARRLRADLDVEPSSDTMQLIARIRAGGATDGTQSPGTRGRP